MDELLISKLQDKIEYTFNDTALLIKSMTHSSYANEKIRKNNDSNERLEFLGDSLLGMTVAILIFSIEPQLSEGQMTKLRAELVCERSLAEIASELDLGSFLLLGKGEKNGGGQSRPSILSDAFEALIGAIYLDGGFEPVEKLIAKHFTEKANNPVKIFKDYKTQLQEVIQAEQGQKLSYIIKDETGPDHDKSFEVEVKTGDKIIGTGMGKSKKLAEQEAAKAALDAIKSE
ncbi:MAG: ribonuclease III [Oscillospiraceae bacterium]|nr:ribonuclease III [Oscillospiraceae bacterium]